MNTPAVKPSGARSSIRYAARKEKARRLTKRAGLFLICRPRYAGSGRGRSGGGECGVRRSS